MKKLKTFESYGDTGHQDRPKNDKSLIMKHINHEYTDHNSEPSQSIDPINEKIKVIVGNIVKTKVYFKMLRDTTSHVYKNLLAQYPRNVDAFTETVTNKDVILGELVEGVYDIINESDTMKRLEDMIDILEQIETYTGQGNIDRILKGELNIYEDEDEGEESDIEDEDEGLPGEG
jgi:hypothetical protein